MILVIVALVGGVAAGALVSQLVVHQQGKSADKLVRDAEHKAERLIAKSEQSAKQILDDAKRESKQQLNSARQREQTLLDKIEDLDARAERLRNDEQAVSNLKEQAQETREELKRKLEKIAGLSRADAKAKLLQSVEKTCQQDILGYLAKQQQTAEAQAEQNAEMLLVQTMERMASEVTAEHTITAVPLPDDEMKGRIIGKEGRNIQALQRATGVDVLVDETPGMIVLSSFDPVRRQVARLAVEMLLKDGRIHPARIEETVERARKQIEKEVVRAGEDAARECGALGIPPQMIHLLGELKFRTSYGQNVLKHSTEMAQMAGMIAAEVGADVMITKTATLLHDVGKAVTHRIEGKHHHIGAELARKYGMDERIAHAIEAHHDDIEATTPEAVIVRVCDALSAARPGARNISAENFAQRMKELENVATNFEGVKNAYAISAGREVRVMVQPDKIDDLTATRLARDIADRIESTMQYPGTIKVNVIRETRAIEYAK